MICLGVAGNGAAIGYLWIPQSVNSQASHLRQETMEGVGHWDLLWLAWVALLLWLFLGPEKMLQTSSDFRIQVKVSVSLTWKTLGHFCGEVLWMTYLHFSSLFQQFKDVPSLAMIVPRLPLVQSRPLKHVWPRHRMKPSSCTQFFSILWKLSLITLR